MTETTLVQGSARPLSSETEAGRRRASLLAGLGRILFSGSMLAWVDQCIVSGMSFLVLIVIARTSDLSQLGIYAGCSAALALALAAQDALITRPYAIELHRRVGSKEEHGFSVLLLCAALSGAIVLLGGSAALAMVAAGAEWTSIGVACTLAIAVPPVMAREFARRYSFAHLRVAQALLVDAAVAAVNLGLLAYLAGTGRLNAATALAAQGLSCALAVAAWLILVRAEFAPTLRSLREAARRSWRIGKWLLSGQIAVQVQGYTGQWLSLAVLGAASAGVYAAYSSTVALANPFVFGLINVMVPKSARSFVDGGGRGVWAQAVRDALLLCAVMGAFCLAFALVGEHVTTAVFHGAGGNRPLLLLLCIASLVSAAGVPASVALNSADRTRTVAAATATTSALNLALAWTLMAQFGLLGAGLAFLAAEVIGSVWRWAALAAFVGNRPAAQVSK